MSTYPEAAALVYIRRELEVTRYGDSVGIDAMSDRIIATLRANGLVIGPDATDTDTDKVDTELADRVEREAAHAEAVAMQCDDPKGRRAWKQFVYGPDARDRNGDMLPAYDRIRARVDGHVGIYLREYATTMRAAAKRLRGESE